MQTKKKIGAPPGPRPRAWKSGPDPLRHEQYRAYVQQKNQAQWRGESWEIDFELWCSFWQEHWQHRGRDRDSYCMIRRDPDDAWEPSNIEVVPRSEHHFNHRQRQILKRNRKNYG